MELEIITCKNTIIVHRFIKPTEPKTVCTFKKPFKTQKMLTWYLLKSVPGVGRPLVTKCVNHECPCRVLFLNRLSPNVCTPILTIFQFSSGWWKYKTRNAQHFSDKIVALSLNLLLPSRFSNWILSPLGLYIHSVRTGVCFFLAVTTCVGIPISWV